MARKDTFRGSVFIEPENIEKWRNLENKSAFVNMALRDSAGIMTWNLLKQQKPDQFKDPQRTPEQIAEIEADFNKITPVDPLTALRRKKSCKNSQPQQETW